MNGYPGNISRCSAAPAIVPKSQKEGSLKKLRKDKTLIFSDVVIPVQKMDVYHLIVTEKQASLEAYWRDEKIQLCRPWNYVILYESDYGSKKSNPKRRSKDNQNPIQRQYKTKASN
jgi:hypothetical protein